MEEMSDFEFITHADYLSSPYYRAYLAEKIRGERLDVLYGGNHYSSVRPPVYPQPGYPQQGYPQYGYPQQGAYRQQPVAGQPVREESGRGKKKGSRAKLYVKKRKLPLFLIGLVMLITIAVGALGFLNIKEIDPYIGIYKVPAGEGYASITLSDTVSSLVNVLFKTDMKSVYYDNYLSKIADNAGTLTKISIYAVPVAAVLTILLAVIGFIKALAALLSGRKSDGYFRKFKFGFLSIASFLCGAIFLLGGLYVSGIKLDQILNFITFKTEAMQAGYVLYAMIIIPIITFILTCISYKKYKIK